MTLQEFHRDKDTLKVVKDFLFDYLTEHGVKKMFAGEDTKGMAEAKEFLERAFDELDTMFIQPVKKKKPKNEAR